MLLWLIWDFSLADLTWLRFSLAKLDRVVLFYLQPQFHSSSLIVRAISPGQLGFVPCMMCTIWDITFVR